MDATTRASRFTVLAISVLYRGCAIPVAWKIVRSHEKGSWEPYWKELFTVLQGSVPKDWMVLVLADRGLYAPWLFKHIVSVGWHPFLRINLGGKVRPVGDENPGRERLGVVMWTALWARHSAARGFHVGMQATLILGSS